MTPHPRPAWTRVAPCRPRSSMAVPTHNSFAPGEEVYDIWRLLLRDSEVGADVADGSRRCSCGFGW
jgi:hypothetical protein